MNELPEVFDERHADAQAIQSLRNEIRRLTPMSLLQLKDGTVVRVSSYEAVDRAELQEKRNDLAAELAKIDALLDESKPATPHAAAPSTPAPEPAPQPAATGPVDPTGQPVNVQPQVTPLAGSLPQTEAPAAPVAPIAPSTDPIQ